MQEGAVKLRSTKTRQPLQQQKTLHHELQKSDMLEVPVARTRPWKGNVETWSPKPSVLGFQQLLFCSANPTRGTGIGR